MVQLSSNKVRIKAVEMPFHLASFLKTFLDCQKSNHHRVKHMHFGTLSHRSALGHRRELSMWFSERLLPRLQSVVHQGDVAVAVKLVDPLRDDLQGCVQQLQLALSGRFQQTLCLHLHAHLNAVDTTCREGGEGGREGGRGGRGEAI